MKISKINRGSWGKVRAFFDLETEGLTIKGFKLVEGINGLFTGFPSEKDKDGEYRDTVWASKEVKNMVNDLAIAAYSQVEPAITESNPVEVSEGNFDDEDIPF